MADDWSRAEVEAIVADYFSMLRDELVGKSVNKSAHRQNLRRLLNGRSEASIEFKHANISAVLDEEGRPSIEGYKRRSNYQELLRNIVLERLARDGELERLTRSIVEAPVLVQPSLMDLTSVIVDPPHGEDRNPHERSSARSFPRQGINYLEREAHNHSLGTAGEEFVLQVEHARLSRHGARRYADRIEHVSRTRGDGLGFDILSYEPNGAERLIEVKTTRFGPMTPFFATSNEVEVSVGRGERYHLYRVFRFERAPRIFILPGSLRKSVVLDPAVYRASLP